MTIVRNLSTAIQHSTPASFIIAVLCIYVVYNNSLGAAAGYVLSNITHNTVGKWRNATEYQQYMVRELGL